MFRYYQYHVNCYQKLNLYGILSNELCSAAHFNPKTLLRYHGLIVYYRYPFCLLACLHKTSTKVYGRIRDSLAARPPAHRFGLLPPDDHWGGSFIGRWYEDVFNKTLAFSFQGLVVGSFFYSLPFAVQPFQSSFTAVDKRLIEASWSLGRSRLYTFFAVILPLSRQGIITGCVLSFAHTLGEFGVVLMIGGNIPRSNKGGVRCDLR